MKNVTTIAVLVKAWLARIKMPENVSTIGREYGLVRTATATFLLLGALLGTARLCGWCKKATIVVRTLVMRLSSARKAKSPYSLSGLFAIGRFLQRFGEGRLDCLVGAERRQ